MQYTQYSKVNLMQYTQLIDNAFLIIIWTEKKLNLTSIRHQSAL